ncbi:hypothetical protein DOT_2935 [Desulfosporosinus sp. OT]|nr:hypothetical protein DOT_2935 [Desulfosporosinus sp. OT]
MVNADLERSFLSPTQLKIINDRVDAAKELCAENSQNTIYCTMAEGKH